MDHGCWTGGAVAGAMAFDEEGRLFVAERSERIRGRTDSLQDPERQDGYRQYSMQRIPGHPRSPADGGVFVASKGDILC
jgi:hypothetical protein